MKEHCINYMRRLDEEYKRKILSCKTCECRSCDYYIEAQKIPNTSNKFKEIVKE